LFGISSLSQARPKARSKTRSWAADFTLFLYLVFKEPTTRRGSRGCTAGATASPFHPGEKDHKATGIGCQPPCRRGLVHRTEGRYPKVRGTWCQPPADRSVPLSKATCSAPPLQQAGTLQRFRGGVQPPGAAKDQGSGNSRNRRPMSLSHGPYSEDNSRRRPTLPHTCARSTIGAGGLNCRVRNGNGCFPPATVTGKLEP
jgi:hypothetical protein